MRNSEVGELSKRADRHTSGVSCTALQSNVVVASFESTLPRVLPSIMRGTFVRKLTIARMAYQ